MAQRYIKVFFDFNDAVKALDMAERGRLITAMVEYADTGRVPEDAMPGNERFLFPVFRGQIDRDGDAYAARVRQNSANGKKGGRPPKDREKRTGFLESEKSEDEDKEEEQDKDQDQDQEKDKHKEKDQYAGGGGPVGPAPTLDEVLEYCRATGSKVDGGVFWHYYQANGWRAGNAAIRDWRAKLGEWAARDAGGDAPRDHAERSAPVNPALNYEQREYREEDFGDDFFVDPSVYGA